MPIVDMKVLRAALAPGARILALDLGEKTIGLAISDGSLTIASPLDTLKRSKFQADAAALEAIMAARGCGGMVLGLPINMDGSEGPRCQSTRQFAANLLARQDWLLAFWDERLSTASVQRMLVEEADLSRRRRGELVDKLAAAYILQGALDASRSS
jgi:putative Holliday junction resolvase